MVFLSLSFAEGQAEHPAQEEQPQSQPVFPFFLRIIAAVTTPTTAAAAKTIITISIGFIALPFYFKRAAF